MIIIGLILIIFAFIFLMIAAIGILRLPDALSRQHAATKAATLAINSFAIGLMCIAIANNWGWDWLVRLGFIVIFLLLTLPIASHTLAQASMAESENAS